MESATKQFRKRNAILHCLQQSKAHPSAETLFAELKSDMPDISLATVYRNLSLFKKQGLVVSVASVNGVERFDGNTDPHVHLICNDCGAVIDLEDMSVPQTLVNEAAQCSGGTVSGCQLSFTGQCRECISKIQSA